MSDQPVEHKSLSQPTVEEIQSILGTDPTAAAVRARALVTAQPDNPRAHRVLAAALRRLGRHEEAARSDVETIQASARSKPLLEALSAMRAKQVERAERILRSYLASDPDDPQALRMLAEIAAVCGHGQDAERLLRKALEQAPGFVPLYINLATLLQDLGRAAEAIALLDGLLAQDPVHRLVLSVKAGLLAASGQTREALSAYERLIACAPDAVDAWTNYAGLLKALGRLDDAVIAYRKALDLDPGYGFAWWGLASLRTAKLGDDDIEAIQKSLPDVADDLSRLQLHFSLGRALGDRQRFEESFHHYAAANELRSTLIPYDPRQIEQVVRSAQAVLTHEFLAPRGHHGPAAAGPIFIVGLPRSGSTLVEQILASHPQIEGVGELFDLDEIVRNFTAQAGGTANWPEVVGGAGAEDLRKLGEDYLAAVQRHRRTMRSFFTDKMPFNWSYAGLIHLILPNARIIDVRRHPIACCFSNFTLYFNRATNFASNLEDLGRYYCAYVRMMDHLDQVLPGRIHRLEYEKLVEDPEGEIRRLLEHLGLPFDEACLRFHENPREVHTPSAGQVRGPINKDGVTFWRNYEAWLGPLKNNIESIF